MVSRRAVSKVPDYVARAVKECKEGNERACEVFRDYVDSLRSLYLKYKTESFITTIVTALAFTMSLILRAGIAIGLVALVVFSILMFYIWHSYRSVEALLEIIYTLYLDPPMFLGEAKRFGIFALVEIIICILILLILYSLHIIPLT